MEENIICSYCNRIGKYFYMSRNCILLAYCQHDLDIEDPVRLAFYKIISEKKYIKYLSIQ